jgi:purine-cytosine permease-like protein
MIVCRPADVAFGDGYIEIGLRQIAKSAVFEYQLQRRTPLEALLLFGLVGACLVALLFVRVVAGWIGLALLGAAFTAGAFWEMGRPYVLVMHVHGLGAVEVRNLTLAQAEAAAIELAEE